MINMKYRFCFKKHATNGAMSGKYCTFAQTNHNNAAQMRLRLIILSFLMMAFFTAIQGQTMPGSSIISRTYLSADSTRLMEQRVYDNGLGDVVQEIQSWPGSTLPGIAVHHEYDEYRRRTKTWLPVTTSSSGYVSGTTIASQAQSQYSDTAPYSRTEYDRFLPSQPSAQYKAGAQWQGSDKKQTVTYSEYVGAGMFSPEDGYFYIISAIKYLRTQTTDEDTCWTAEYTDLNGRLLVSETSQGKTYYMYDAKGDITYVIPPILSAYLISYYGDESQEILDTDEMMQKYAYIYRYDNQRHCIFKKLPGCDSIYYVYDKTGACILTQDGNLRQSGKWAYSIPDKFGRPCISGVCQFTGSYADEPLHACHVYAEYDGSSAATGGYTVRNLTLTEQTLYTATYYDGYSFIGSHGVPSSLTASSVSGFPVDASICHGLPTGSATAIFSDGSVTGYTYAAMYYDSRYNISQVKATDHLGGTSVTSTSYSYTGKPQGVKIQHMRSGTGTMEADYAYAYDDADRKDSCILSVAHGNPARSTAIYYEYDDLGRLTKVNRQKKSNANLEITYSYDLHGWLTSLSTGGFQERLYYADGLDGGCYNGNISTVKWKTMSDNVYQGYNLKYDSSNRLTSAVFGSGDNLTSYQNYFNESAQYDANGNISRLWRCGLVDNIHGGFGLVDNLSMTYDGNRLTSVRDNASHLSYAGATDFDGVAGQEYPLTYNDAGSLVSDAGRKIARIDYDLNNNPSRIQFTNGNVTRYIYGAKGEKLRVTHQTAVPNITVAIGCTRELAPYEIQYTDSTDYLLGGSLTLKNGSIDKYYFDEGYCQASHYSATQDNFTFCYYDRDHLGSIRQVRRFILNNTNGTLLQSMNYYPFGLQFCDGSASNGDVQPHKYNGKEFDGMHGLNTYDYGARQYNPILGRWDRMDPLCEKYYSISPYVYCVNNPVNAIDPDGRIVRDCKGQIVYVSSGIIEQYAHPSGSIGTLEKGYIFTNNCQPVEVYKNRGTEKGWDTDCHGFTFADGKYWINNDQVKRILKGDNYSNIKLDQATSGDVVVYYENNDVEHSVTIVNSDGTQKGTIVYGLGGLETEAQKSTLPDGWHSSGKVQFGVYRKEEVDRVVSDEEIFEYQEKIRKHENHK